MPTGVDSRANNGFYYNGKREVTKGGERNGNENRRRPPDDNFNFVDWNSR